MDRVFDKGIILIVCAASLLFVPFTTVFVVALLLAIVITFLNEIRVIPRVVGLCGIGLYLVVAFFVPEFVFFVPIVSYDYLRQDSWFYRLIWAAPLLTGLRFLTPTSAIYLFGVAGIMAILALRTLHIEQEINSYIELRDVLREESFSLERKNRDLRDRQDMEVHLATLDERGRIAREIHDNVGHLLTRSVLQVEALQVVHAEDQQIRREFEEVGTTVHEALNTVRESVHNLHADSFDLEAQLKRTVSENKELDINLEYFAEDINTAIAYCFIALTREAISNTLKHSNADAMNISVLEQPGFYRLTISDNGEEKNKHVELRMAPATVQDSLKGGIGLRTMEERVRNLDGFFRIDSTEGFRIIVSIPKQETNTP